MSKIEADPFNPIFFPRPGGAIRLKSKLDAEQRREKNEIRILRAITGAMAIAVCVIISLPTARPELSLAQAKMMLDDSSPSAASPIVEDAVETAHSDGMRMYWIMN